MVNGYMTDVEFNIVYFIGEKEWKLLTNDGGATSICWLGGG